MQSGFWQILRVPGSVKYSFSYNMDTCALPDMYALGLLAYVHIRQSTCAQVITYT